MNHADADLTALWRAAYVLIAEPEERPCDWPTCRVMTRVDCLAPHAFGEFGELYCPHCCEALERDAADNEERSDEFGLQGG